MVVAGDPWENVALKRNIKSTSFRLRALHAICLATQPIHKNMAAQLQNLYGFTHITTKSMRRREVK